MRPLIKVGEGDVTAEILYGWKSSDFGTHEDGCCEGSIFRGIFVWSLKSRISQVGSCRGERSSNFRAPPTPPVLGVALAGQTFRSPGAPGAARFAACRAPPSAGPGVARGRTGGGRPELYLPSPPKAQPARRPAVKGSRMGERPDVPLAQRDAAAGPGGRLPWSSGLGGGC